MLFGGRDANEVEGGRRRAGATTVWRRLGATFRLAASPPPEGKLAGEVIGRGVAWQGGRQAVGTAPVWGPSVLGGGPTPMAREGLEAWMRRVVP